MAITIKETSDRLASWRPGQRGWFWLCPDLDDSQPVLALRALGEDAQMSILRDDIAGLAPSGARTRMGLASVGADGSVSFGGEGLAASDLTRLAAWVRSNLRAHPSLARLRNAELVCVDGEVVADRIRDASLWDGVPSARVPGSLDEAIRRLGRLKPGANYWYWMTSAGPGGQPFLLLGAQKRDPSGEGFASVVRHTRRAAPASGPACQGVLRRLDSGALVFTTDGDPEQGAAILSALLAAEPERLAVLADAKVAQLKDGVFTAIARPAAAPDLSRQVAALAALAAGEAVSFWLTDADRDGQPLLLLETDRDALREGAQAAAGSGQSLRGQLLRSRSSWLELRSRSFWPDGLAALATWLTANVAHAPELAVLKGARMTKQDKTGALIARYKDDRLWV